MPSISKIPMFEAFCNHRDIETKIIADAFASIFIMGTLVMLVLFAGQFDSKSPADVLASIPGFLKTYVVFLMLWAFMLNTVLWIKHTFSRR
jgi:hypothetical protein